MESVRPPLVRARLPSVRAGELMVRYSLAPRVALRPWSPRAAFVGGLSVWLTLEAREAMQRRATRRTERAEATAVGMRHAHP
ncbi:hypothetical protein NR798_19015 [Archangium gephyra]|uniref:hypothetical protein n=1 Tax=Archangium gephyra TaxID=48 RepID=UPI0035D45DEE